MLAKSYLVVYNNYDNKNTDDKNQQNLEWIGFVLPLSTVEQHSSIKDIKYIIRLFNNVKIIAWLWQMDETRLRQYLSQNWLGN